MNRIKSIPSIDLEWLILVYFSALALLPSMADVSFYIPLLIGVLYVVYIGILRNNSETVYIYLVFFAGIIFISLLYTFFVSSSSIASDASNRILKRFLSKIYQYFLMFFPLFAGTRSVKMSRTKRITLVVLNVLCVLYVMRTTMAEIAINENATRSWVGEVTNENVAGYYFVYAIPFLFLVFSYMAMASKKLWLRLISVAIAIYSFVFLINAQYTLSIIISIIGLYLMQFSVYKKPYMVVIMLLVTVCLIFTLPILIDWMSSVIKYSAVSLRLSEISDFLKTGNATGYNLGGRLELYSQSLKAFFSSPIWGNSNFDVDGHSTFLMILADLGLLGAIPFFRLIYRSKSICLRYVENKSTFNVLFLAFIAMGLTNPVHSSSASSWSLWFICPLILSLMQNTEVSNEKMEN